MMIPALHHRIPIPALALVLACPVGAIAQEEELKEARGALAQGDCSAATEAASRSMKKGVTSEAHFIIGRCLYAEDLNDSARYHLEKAVELDERNADALFWLGNVLSDLGRPEDALVQFKRYSAIEPGELKGPTQQAYVWMSQLDQPDSALRILEACYSRDPADASTLYYMGLCYRHKDLSEQAYHWIAEGAKAHPDDADFPAVQGRWLIEDGEWARGAEASDQAFAIEPKLRYAQRSAFASVMSHTAEDAFTRNGDTLLFTRIGHNDLATLDRALADSAGPYFFDPLLARFQADPRSLSLDQVFMVYYGQHTLETYSPYADNPGTELSPPANEGKWEEVRSLAEAHLAGHPMCLDALRYKAMACDHLDDMDAAAEAIGRYECMMRAILATGSGRSTTDALIVMSPHDEYTLIGYQGLDSHGQALLNDDGHSFDLLTCQDEDEKEHRVYFNITKPFGSLSKMFKDVELDKPKKKRKKDK